MDPYKLVGLDGPHNIRNKDDLEHVRKRVKKKWRDLTNQGKHYDAKALNRAWEQVKNAFEKPPEEILGRSRMNRLQDKFFNHQTKEMTKQGKDINRAHKEQQMAMNKRFQNHHQGSNSHAIRQKMKEQYYRLKRARQQQPTPTGPKPSTIQMLKKVMGHVVVRNKFTKSVVLLRKWVLELLEYDTRHYGLEAIQQLVETGFCCKFSEVAKIVDETFAQMLELNPDFCDRNPVIQTMWRDVMIPHCKVHFIEDSFKLNSFILNLKKLIEGDMVKNDLEFNNCERWREGAWEKLEALQGPTLLPNVDGSSSSSNIVPIPLPEPEPYFFEGWAGGVIDPKSENPSENAEVADVPTPMSNIQSGSPATDDSEIEGPSPKRQKIEQDAPVSPVSDSDSDSDDDMFAAARAMLKQKESSSQNKNGNQGEVIEGEDATDGAVKTGVNGTTSSTSSSIGTGPQSTPDIMVSPATVIASPGDPNSVAAVSPVTPSESDPDCTPKPNKAGVSSTSSPNVNGTVTAPDTTTVAIPPTRTSSHGNGHHSHSKKLRYEPPSVPYQKRCLRLQLIILLQTLAEVRSKKSFLRSTLDPFFLYMFQTRNQLGLDKASIKIVEDIQSNIHVTNVAKERNVGGPVLNPLQAARPVVDKNRGTKELGAGVWGQASDF